MAVNKTLTKADIVESLFEKTNRNRVQLHSIVDSLFATMSQALKRDGSLLLSGFGKFECYEKASRRGRNPQTSEVIVLPPHKVVVFRISRKFRNELNAVVPE